jgi:hypothetical protein
MDNFLYAAGLPTHFEWEDEPEDTTCDARVTKAAYHATAPTSHELAKTLENHSPHEPEIDPRLRGEDRVANNNLPTMIKVWAVVNVRGTVVEQSLKCGFRRN